MGIRSKIEDGFTLIELLIVAIMLAVLAAIVIPQFSSTSVSARESALRADLAALRSAISLYRQEHGDFPGAVRSSGPGCSGGPGGSGPAGSQQAFEDQLLMYTKFQGTACPRLVGSAFTLGPYLSQALPVNPVTGDKTLVVIGSADVLAGDLSMSGDSPGGGWKYDVISGRFIANDTSTDSTGTAYDTY